METIWTSKRIRKKENITSKIFYDEKGKNEEKKKKKERKKELTCLQRRTEKEERQKERKEESDRWEREGKSNLTRLMGPSSVCLFTKMSWTLNFHNLKTPKMCFQFC